jgi:DNA-binding response OmpR family regulator
MRLLVVEDNAKLRQLLVGLFSDARYAVDAVGTAREAREALRVANYDIILTELRLPDGDGSAVVRELRRRGVGTPVLIGTSVTDLERRVEALDDGADDVMVKPFSSDELLARVRALLRRPPNVLNRVLSVGNISLDTAARAVQVDGDAVELTRREIAVLETLMRHRTRPVAKRALEEAVYSFSEDVSPNAIEAAVSRVRRRLDNAGARVTISAARGMGYLLSERSL